LTQAISAHTGLILQTLPCRHIVMDLRSLQTLGLNHVRKVSYVIQKPATGNWKDIVVAAAAVPATGTSEPRPAGVEQPPYEQLGVEDANRQEGNGQLLVGPGEVDRAELHPASEQLVPEQVQDKGCTLQAEGEQTLAAQIEGNDMKLQQDSDLTRGNTATNKSFAMLEGSQHCVPELADKEILPPHEEQQACVEEHVEGKEAQLPASIEVCQQQAQVFVEGEGKKVQEVLEATEQLEDGLAIDQAELGSKSDGEAKDGSAASDSESGFTRTPGSTWPSMPSRDASGLDLPSLPTQIVPSRPQTCCVSFVCDSTQHGECLALVGADPILGGWDVQKAVRLTTSAASFPTWSCDIMLPEAGSEFKLVILRERHGDTSWEPIPGNRVWPHEMPSSPLAVFGR